MDLSWTREPSAPPEYRLPLPHVPGWSRDELIGPGAEIEGPVPIPLGLHDTVVPVEDVFSTTGPRRYKITYILPQREFRYEAVAVNL